MAPIVPGQRWISDAEPELGLGTILEADARTVTIGFGSSATVRRYTIAAAPIRRARFGVGDRIRAAGGAPATVETVAEVDGLLTYRAGGRAIVETDLADTTTFTRPEQRLRNGQVDAGKLFALRADTLRHRQAMLRSPVRGLVGARVQLVPHQLFIAHEAVARPAPRVLLADEVGLGKTIEACLIVHHLLVTGRIARVLVIVPAALVHQWLVELLRKFNLRVSVFDEARCREHQADEDADPDANPFTDAQLVLCALSWLEEQPRRARQAVLAGWDVVVVDEAHHLAWREDATSIGYTIVEELARRTPGLLLLTATPERQGDRGHFARLRLLDPERFPALDAFQAEAATYHRVARVARHLVDGDLEADEARELRRALPPAIASLIESPPASERERAERLDELLDRYGTGRGVFRNTRRVVGGFPRRVPHLVPLAPDASVAAEPAALADEALDRRDPVTLEHDPRVPWLADLLRGADTDKVLLICRTAARAAAIDQALAHHLSVKRAVFDERMSLLERDRHAAYFADPEGARLLISSEIGSEGRNFQFASHLVLFDLPLDPDLLEQRIGRLDRIGQTREVHIHVPYLAGTCQELLVRWHDEGIGGLRHPVSSGDPYRQAFEDRVRALVRAYGRRGRLDRAGTDQLVADTRRFGAALQAQLESGRDRLLELASYRPGPGAELVGAVEAVDRDPALGTFLPRLLDHLGVHCEELDPATILLDPDTLVTDGFTSLLSGRRAATFARPRALAREDLVFLTWDHPLVGEAMERLLSSEHGNCAVVVGDDPTERDVVLEAIYVLECVADPALRVDRFLPPTPLVVRVDAGGRTPGARADTAPGHDLTPHGREEAAARLVARLPALLDRAEPEAERQAEAARSAASASAARRLDAEVARARALARVNPAIDARAVEARVDLRARVLDAIGQARLRLDALCLILPAGDGA